jgi:hypothetical protein
MLSVFRNGTPDHNTMGGEMKQQMKAGRMLTGLAILAAIAILATAGCTDTTAGQQVPATTFSEMHSENPAVEVTAAVRSGTITATQGTTQPASAPVSSTGVVMVDPVGDKNTGETFTLSGTTSLPEKTMLIWQVLPDTGTAPTGIDGNSMMAVGGNAPVTQGNGTMNRISIPVDLGRLVPGRYAVIAGKAKEGTDGKVGFEIGNDYSYTYFHIK